MRKTTAERTAGLMLIKQAEPALAVAHRPDGRLVPVQIRPQAGERIVVIRAELWGGGTTFL